MENPTPLREMREGPDARVGDLVEAARPVADWPLDRRAATLWALKARTRAPRRRGWLVGGGLAAAAVAAAALLLLVRGGAPAVPTAAPALVASASVATSQVSLGDWEVLSLGDLGTIETRRDASVVLREESNERQVRLAAGLLRAQIAHQDPLRPLVVLTPHLRVVVVGTRFDVEVDSDYTRVAVLEGRVRVERGLGSVLVGGGESIRSDDARLQEERAVPERASPAAAVKPGPVRAPAFARSAVADCERPADLAARKGCLRRVASGAGLAAQNALHELALLARDEERNAAQALRWWRSYQQRFPDGVLGPEVALGLFETCVRAHRLEEAGEVAVAFERQYRDDPRRGEVALAHAALLCAAPRTRSAGRALLTPLARDGDPAIRKMAMQAQARCSDDAPPWDLHWNALLPRFDDRDATQD